MLNHLLTNASGHSTGAMLCWQGVVVLTSKILCLCGLRLYHQLSCVCPFCNKSHNSRDLLVNHIRFHYRMVLMCPICGGCRSHQWRTVEGHVKKCAAAWPNIASMKVQPGEPHWRILDLPLMNDTQAPETEAMYTLQVWPDPPNNEEPTHQGQIFEHNRREWETQVVNFRGDVAAEARGRQR